MKSTKQGKVVFNMFSVTRLLICIQNNKEKYNLLTIYNITPFLSYKYFRDCLRELHDKQVNT